jgi:hypothetical protein
VRAWCQRARHRARIVFDRLGDLFNITLYCRGNRLDVRVLDVLMGSVFIGGVAYAWLAWGWLSALQMAAVFGFTVLCVVWFFPSDKETK